MDQKDRQMVVKDIWGGIRVVATEGMGKSVGLYCVDREYDCSL